MFKGLYTAVITPFNAQDEIDWEAYRKLLSLQKQSGISGVVICGTTAEAPTLRSEERKKLIEVAVQEFKSEGFEVLAGTGSNCTRSTIEFSKWASDAGVDGLLVVTPYYNKPNQLGLVRHFTSVADAVSVPVMLYNIPGRCGVQLELDTIVELARHPRITSIKEATGSVSFASEIIQRLKQESLPLSVLTGDDSNLLATLSVGGDGGVSVVSNLYPVRANQIVQAFEAGRWSDAQSMHHTLTPLFKALFIEPNPVPVKYAMSIFGLCQPDVRAPLVDLGAESVKKIDRLIDDLGAPLEATETK